MPHSSQRTGRERESERDSGERDRHRSYRSRREETDEEEGEEEDDEEQDDERNGNEESDDSEAEKQKERRAAAAAARAQHGGRQVLQNWLILSHAGSLLLVQPCHWHRFYAYLPGTAAPAGASRLWLAEH